MSAITDPALVLAVTVEPSARPRDTDAKIRYAGRMRRVTLDGDDTLGIVMGGNFFPLDESTHERVNRTLSEGTDPGLIATPTVILAPAPPRTPPVPASVRVRFLPGSRGVPERVQARDALGRLHAIPRTVKGMTNAYQLIELLYDYATATHDISFARTNTGAIFTFTPKAIK